MVASLERFLQLQTQGMNEPQIVGTMQEEGFSMKDINDSMNQAKIKEAVSQEPEQGYGDYNQSIQNQYPPQQQMTAALPIPPQEQYVPQEQYAQQYGPYSPEQYQGQGYYPDQGVGSSETFTDIAEQVVSEKTEEITKKVEILVQSKSIMQRDIEDIKQRVKRIEETMDQLQRAIIGKVGEFGESNKIVQRDLENIHGTLSKMMNPLIDNYNELRKMNATKNTKK